MLFSALVALAGQVAAAAAGPNIKQRAISPQAYCSSSDGEYKLRAFSAPVRGNGSPGGVSTWKLDIDDTPSGYKQKITGFGAAVTDATVTVFNQLPAAKLSQLLIDLMTGEGSEGVNFNLMRHTIASSDLSGDPAYSYDDNGGNADTSLSAFNLGDRGNAMAVMLKKMKDLSSGTTIVGSAWAPPAWMQLDRKLTGTTVNNNLDHAYVNQYAQYFVKYLQAYQQKGVNVDAITIQNEPLNSNAGFPTMYIFADESGRLINENVGPALRAAGFNTQIWAYDHNTDVPSYPQTVLNIAPAYVPAVAWHCYANPLNWTVLTDFHNRNPNIAQYMTECWTSSQGKTPWNQASSFTIGPLQNWGQGSIAWNLGSDNSDGPHLSGNGPCTTCRGLVTIDAASGTYTKQVDYYMLGQYSKFMPRGATVLSGTGSYTYEGGGGVESVATRNNDGTRTVVIQNTFGNDLYITLTTKSGETWSGLIRTKSVVTWLLPAVG